MALMHLVTLSEANSNDVDAQKWLLDQVCNRVQFLGKVTLTTTNSTYDDLSTLIALLCQTYAASGCNFWPLFEMLQERLKEEEAQYPPEQIKSAQEEWDNRGDRFFREIWDIECRRGEELKQMRLRYFFKPRR